MRPSTGLRALVPRLLLGALVAAGCAGTPRAPAQPAAVPDLPAAVREVEAYLGSGRYDADVAAVVAQARAYLEARAPEVARPAIVLDIDETALSNWPAYKLNGWARITSGGCDLEQGPCGVRAWQALARSEAIEPTRALAQRARELGVAVFFVSGRPASLREATERNLRERGYAWEEVVIHPEGAHFASAVDFKAPVRRAIEARGYTILFSLGDQASDLDGGFAERTFKLPNPVYFLP